MTQLILSASTARFAWPRDLCVMSQYVHIYFHLLQKIKQLD